MSYGKKTELVQKLYAAFGRGDVPTILEHTTDDIDWGMEVKPPTDVPWYGLGTGKKFVAAFFTSLAQECAFTRFEPTEFLESESSVVCLVTTECTFKRSGHHVELEKFWGGPAIKHARRFAKAFAVFAKSLDNFVNE